jgi:hypothetical protein
MPHDLIPSQPGRHPFPGNTRNLQQFTVGLFYQLSLIGLFALFLNGIFLALGFYLFWWHEDPRAPLFFFSLVFILMYVYASFCGSHANKRESKREGFAWRTGEFQGGSISARGVICLMAFSTSLAFAIAIGLANFHDWQTPAMSAPFYTWVYSAALDAVVFSFSEFYTNYVNKADGDMLPSGTRRYFSGRGTILFLTVLTLLVFGAHLIRALMSTEETIPILFRTVAFATSAAICIWRLTKFQNEVTLEEDRGYKQG